jgi:hypothetical protein
MGSLFGRRKPDALETTIKKLASGEIGLDSILNPNPIFLVINFKPGRYKLQGGIILNKKKFREWKANLPADARLILIELDRASQPIGTNPEHIRSSELAAHQERDEAKSRAVLALAEKPDAELTDEQRKTRWWSRYGGKWETEEKKIEIKAESISGYDFIVDDMTSLPDHIAMNERIGQTIIRTFQIG